MTPDPAEPQTPDRDLDIGLLEYLQTLTPAQRIERADHAAELVRALRRAGAQHYGFDPRAPETTD